MRRSNSAREVSGMWGLKNCRGQSMIEWIGVVTVVLTVLVIVLNGTFRNAVNKTFESSAGAVSRVGDQLSSEVGTK